MVRASKTSDKTTTETKSRSKAAPKVEAAPTPAPEPVVEATESEPSDPAAFINQRLAEFSAKLQQLTRILLPLRLTSRLLVKTSLV